MTREVQSVFVGGDIALYQLSRPYWVLFPHKLCFQKIFGNRQCVIGVRRRLEHFLLLATNAVFFADALGPVHADLDTLFGRFVRNVQARRLPGFSG